VYGGVCGGLGRFARAASFLAKRDFPPDGRNSRKGIIGGPFGCLQEVPPLYVLKALAIRAKKGGTANPQGGFSGADELYIGKRHINSASLFSPLYLATAMGGVSSSCWGVGPLIIF